MPRIPSLQVLPNSRIAFFPKPPEIAGGLNRPFCLWQQRDHDGDLGILVHVVELLQNVAHAGLLLLVIMMRAALPFLSAMRSGAYLSSFSLLHLFVLKHQPHISRFSRVVQAMGGTAKGRK